MALGALILALAFLDELVLELTGQRVETTNDEPLRSE
jgi:hypothetical protein